MKQSMKKDILAPDMLAYTLITNPFIFIQIILCCFPLLLYELQRILHLLAILKNMHTSKMIQCNTLLGTVGKQLHIFYFLFQFTGKYKKKKIIPKDNGHEVETYLEKLGRLHRKNKNGSQKKEISKDTIPI